MIKKKNNSYMLIKKNIAKLAIIHQTTNISPNRLVALFLKSFSDEDLLLPKKTKDGFWDWKLSDNTAYKYFKKELAGYMKRNQNDQGFLMMLEHFKSNYLAKEYFGENYQFLADNYYALEQPLKDFVKEAFIAVHPITPAMSPKEIAVRNQKLGKISVKHWIGDITNYDYFSQAPSFMMQNVQQALQYIDLYIMNILNEKQLDSELMKLSTNQRLEVKLSPKEALRTKIQKI
ncbi:MAG: hypothetical protein Q7K13_04720 [Polynucleobacter sp.]|uniref:hypothetical protein n=1 Tax=Polynucleobacter sp. TaxID=2029855 RepID=UPI002726D3EA|nr:hypothetical protein [Polynucleobacter sp.]MDO8713766.1 hypothetical protein [Polynucleobacter sp.]